VEIVFLIGAAQHPCHATTLIPIKAIDEAVRNA
jgi:hypothetical protein